MNTVMRIYCGRNLNNEFRQSPLTESEFDFFLQDVVVPLYEQNMNTISAAYVSRYNQDAVMITQQEVEASLYSR